MEAFAIESAQPGPAGDGWDELISGVCAGAGHAWTELARRLGPLVGGMVRKRSRSIDADGHSDIYVRVLERLSQNTHRALHRYLATREKYPELRFDSYLGAIVASSLVDSVRARPETLRRRQQAARKLVAIQLTSLEEASEPRSSNVAETLERRIEAKRLLAKLVDVRFPTEQRQALLFWLHGHTANEIADALELANAGEAGRLVRAARARLRRASGRDQ